MNWPVHLISRLGDEPAVLMTAILADYAQAQTEGVFPRWRDPPNGGEWVVVAGDLSRPLGWATFYDAGNGVCWLDLLYVRDRGKGIGSALLSAVMVDAERQGFVRLHVGALCHNVPMQNLARKIGLKPAAVIFEARLEKDRLTQR